MTLDELIAALEDAAGPSRKLDAEIARSLGWEPGVYGEQDWWRPPNGDWGGLPRWTKSFDIALTLMDGLPDAELWSWRIAHPGYDDGRLKAPYRADLHSPTSSGGGPSWTGFGANPAIAFDIAALNAKRQMRPWSTLAGSTPATTFSL